MKVNSVYSYEMASYRILQVLNAEVIWIKIDDEKAFPSIIEKDELSHLIENCDIQLIQDPYAYLAFISLEDGSKAQVNRDKSVDLIKDIIDISEALYQPEIRSNEINKVIAAKSVTKRTLYKKLRQYWQRGQCPNALCPEYYKSGGKGKKRQAKEKKLGRPRKYAEGKGAIITAEIERLFRLVIKQHLLSKEKSSIPYAHRKFKSIYEGYHPDISETEMPTLRQFSYFYKRENSQVERIEKQASAIEFKKDIRPLTGTANKGVQGPGSRFEIDATIADIYVVSDSERQNISGRPIIYMVIDVFSRMVAGFYIGFENPSYVTAMQALSCAMTDKVKLCKKFGFEINSEQWPVSGLPDAILADRGELIGYQIESLERVFSVRIENAPPYRGDAKGIVERSFKTIQAEFKPFAPGVVTDTKVRKRGGSDYRLDATLTIHEFTEIILASILHHNQFHVLRKYDKEVDMPTDLQMTPLSIWNWGIQNRTGRLRGAPEDALKISLMPRQRATLSDLGICIFGMYYTSAEILKNGWMHRSKLASRPGYLEAAYDPRTVNHIYIFPNKNSAEYWVCDLTERSREYRDCSFWDMWQLSNEKKKITAKNTLEDEKNRRFLERFIEDKIKIAVSKTPDSTTQSKASRIAAIKDNRKQATAEERKQTAYKPEKKKSSQESAESKIVHLHEQEPDYDFPDSIDELFDED